METGSKVPDKRTVRKAALAARAALDETARKRASILMTERIAGHQWFYRAEDFLCFVSCGSEIDTGEIITEALRQKKKVYVPRVISQGDKAEMEFYRIEDRGQLRPGYRGILEPEGDTEAYCYTPERAERTLMLMPGAAFDRFRNRVGYGKGFYDRYLADREALQLRTIAVGFQCQLVEEIPAESTDIKPCQVICV